MILHRFLESSNSILCTPTCQSRYLSTSVTSYTTCPGPSAPPLPAPAHPSHRRCHSHVGETCASSDVTEPIPRPKTSPKRSATNRAEYLPHHHPGSRVSIPNGHPAPTQAVLHVVIAVHPTPVGSTLIHSPFLSVPLVKGKLPTLPVLTPGFLRHPKDLSQFGTYEDGSSSSRLPYTHLLSS